MLDDIDQEQVLLDAVQKAYRKHWLNDGTIGWDELGDILHNALINTMGDNEFIEWKNSLPYNLQGGLD